MKAPDKTVQSCKQKNSKEVSDTYLTVWLYHGYYKDYLCRD